MLQITEEELTVKHKKERKDLQGKIQSLKKTCVKGDKKRKRELIEEVARLEQDLDDVHSKELEEFYSLEDNGQEAQNTEPKIDTNNKEATNEETPMDENCSSISEQPRVSKAQKRRNKKAQEERDREERIIAQDIKNKNGPRMKELEKINEILIDMGLKSYSIPADGNCLYCAIGHQLEVTGRDKINFPKLREMTANYMREHKDDFLPFMTHIDEDKIFTEDHFEEYCKTLVKKPVWGGHIEIRALSNVLTCPIQVIQADAAMTIQGEQYNGPPLTIAYHRHLYRLGEHYNSTIVLPTEED